MEGGGRAKAGGRVVLRAAGIALGILLLAFIVAGFFLDRLVTAAANRMLGASFTVPARVEAVSLRLLSGTVVVTGMRIANPPGFSHPDFLTLRRGEMGVRLSSLRTDEIVVDRIRTEGLTVRLEKSGSRENTAEIFSRKSGKPRKDEAGKRLRVRRLLLEKTTVSLPLLGGEKELASERVAIEEPTGKGKGELVSDVIGQIVAESIRATAGDSAGRAFLAPLSGLGGEAARAGQSAGDRIKGIFKDLGR